MDCSREMIRQAASRLSKLLNRLQTQVVDVSTGDLAYPHVVAALDECLTKLSRTGLWGNENRIPSSELWNVVGDTLCRGWLQNQARIKPRGYAGDYEMLARIFERRLCDDPLGRLFDRYFQDQAAPQAVRNRMLMMSDWICGAAHGNAASRVAVVGSAFGLEVRAALHALSLEERNRLHVTLLDMDPAALEYARHQLGPWLPAARLTTIPTNVFRLADRPGLAEPLANSDLLFCPGLFDYLEDAAAASMLRLFWNSLAPGGRMVVFQFSPANPTRAYMEWLGNWYLIYRDVRACQQIAERAGLDHQSVSIGAEPLGIGLFISAVKPRAGRTFGSVESS